MGDWELREGMYLVSVEPTEFEKLLNVRYFVACIYEGGDGGVSVELWPCYDEDKRIEFEMYLEEVLRQTIPPSLGFYYRAFFAVKDEIYLSLDEVKRRFKPVNSEGRY